MNDLYRACELAAERIVQAEKELYDNVELYAFDVNVASSDTDSSFQRQGTSQQQKDYNLPEGISGLINQNAQESQVPSTLSTQQISFLQGLVSLIAENIPGLSVLQSSMNMNPTEFAGNSTLDTIANRNPYTSDYETGTQALYERGLDSARARAISGPTNVRGGQSRTGFDLADTNTQAGINRFREVNTAQRQDAGVAEEASQIANAIEVARRGTTMAAQGQIQSGESQRRQAGLGANPMINQLRGVNTANVATAAEFLGKPKATTTDDLAGKGNQSTFSWGGGAGLGCCFIFLEATNGKLPWFVRQARDELGNAYTRAGYRNMAKWLVPMMARSKWMKLWVNLFMVRPMIYYGAWVYQAEHPGRRYGFLFWPVKFFWFKVWEKQGKEKSWPVGLIY